MLRRDPLLAAALACQLAPSFELFDRRCHPDFRPHLREAPIPSTRGLTGQSGGLANVAVQQLHNLG
jgi:hypothetical protein